MNHPIRFFLNQLPVNRRATVEYLVQGHPVRITHNTHDPQVFHEIFVDRYYGLPDGCPTPRTAADLGGNIGMFALYAAIEWPEVRIVAFEPDAANARKYRWMMQNNSIAGELHEACAADRDGTVTLGGQESLARVISDGLGTQTPAVDVFPYLADADLIKMDIEGSEWPLLLDERFAALRARTLIMEYHPYMCPEPDARAAAERALRSAGYDTIESIFHNGASGVGMLRAMKSTRI